MHVNLCYRRDQRFALLSPFRIGGVPVQSKSKLTEGITEANTEATDWFGLSAVRLRASRTTAIRWRVEPAAVSPNHRQDNPTE